MASRVSPFTLMDQYDAQHVIEFRSARPRLFIVADQASAGAAREWGGYLAKSPLKSVSIIPIAAMGDVPELLQGFAKAYVTVKRPTLLDWRNRVSTRLGFMPNECMVALVDGDGRIIGRVTGKVNSVKLDELVRISGIVPVTTTPNVSTSDQRLGLRPSPDILDGAQSTTDSK